MNQIGRFEVGMGVTLFVSDAPPIIRLAAQGWKVPCGIRKEELERWFRMLFNALLEYNILALIF